MFQLDGKPLAVDTPFTHNDIQYPANWLRLASAEEKAEIGIVEVTDPEPYDDRFFWGPGNPKDLEQIRSMMVSQVKATAASLLTPTDWKIIRQAEGGAQVDEATLLKRQAIRQASNLNESVINTCTTVEQLAGLQLVWPEEV